MRKQVLLVVSVVLLGGTAYAADISHDSGLDKRSGEERSESLKSSLEKKDSRTTRDSNTRSRGGESNRSRSDRESASSGKSGGLDMTVSARDLFGDDIIQYKLPVDLGLSAVSKNGMINQTRREWLDEMAKANAYLYEVADEPAVREYFQEVAKTGAAIGQAMIYLQEDVLRLGGVKRTKAALEVTSVGAEDLLSLARGAFMRALAPGGITDARIAARLAEMIADRSHCRLVGSAENIACGKAVLSLGIPPKLQFRGVQWFGDKFAGADATYKISSSWSWTRALENAKSDSTFGRWAIESSDAAERLEAEGRALDAVKTRREAIEKMKSNKFNLSPGRLLPGIQ